MKNFKRKLARFGLLPAAATMAFGASASSADEDKPAIEATSLGINSVLPLSVPFSIQRTDIIPLKFHNLHTEEKMTLPYAKGQGATDSLNWFMRDFRRGEAANLDTALLDLLSDIKLEINKRYPDLDVEFQVISAYRALQTNNALRRSGGSQAKVSQHTHNAAMDIHVPGVSSRELRDIATCLAVGGVGYYEDDDFVHVDTARVRYWPSRAYLSGLSCASKPVANS